MKTKLKTLPTGKRLRTKVTKRISKGEATATIVFALLIYGYTIGLFVVQILTK
jgi:hypothetical protein